MFTRDEIIFSGGIIKNLNWQAHINELIILWGNDRWITDIFKAYDKLINFNNCLCELSDSWLTNPYDSQYCNFLF